MSRKRLKMAVKPHKYDILTFREAKTGFVPRSVTPPKC